MYINENAYSTLKRLLGLENVESGSNQLILDSTQISPQLILIDYVWIADVDMYFAIPAYISVVHYRLLDDDRRLMPDNDRRYCVGAVFTSQFRHEDSLTIAKAVCPLEPDQDLVLPLLSKIDLTPVTRHRQFIGGLDSASLSLDTYFSGGYASLHLGMAIEASGMTGQLLPAAISMCKQIAEKNGDPLLQQVVKSRANLE